MLSIDGVADASSSKPDECVTRYFAI